MTRATGRVSGRSGKVSSYLGEMGVPERVEAVGARFVLFDDDEHVIYPDEADLPAEVGVARAAIESDLIINLPLMKAHSTCLATLCLKNLKGCLRPRDKMEFQRVGLLPAIVGLNRLVRPQINLVDAINAMEGDQNWGPLVPLGVLLAGRDPAGVPLLRLAAEAGLGERRLSEIEITGEPLEPRKFELPQERLSRNYPDLSIDDTDACSACSAALMDGLFIAGGNRRVSSVALGRGATPAPGALVLGDYLRTRWSELPHVEGCPPSGHAVAAALCRDDSVEALRDAQ